VDPGKGTPKCPLQFIFIWEVSSKRGEFSKMISWVRVSYTCRGVLNGFAGGSLRFPAAFVPLLRRCMICCVVITFETIASEQTKQVIGLNAYPTALQSPTLAAPSGSGYSQFGGGFGSSVGRGVSTLRSFILGCPVGLTPTPLGTFWQAIGLSKFECLVQM